VANSRSARKQIRASERKRVRNRTVRSAVRTRVARARRSLVSGQTADLESEVRSAVKALDKAAEKGVLHRNNAARRKSRLMTMAARLGTMSGSEQEKAATRAAAAGGAKGTTTRPSAATARARSAASRPAAPKKAAAKPAAPKTAAAKPGPAKPGAGKAPAAKRTRRSS
jgi:small subunit ribosomal protein S20